METLLKVDGLSKSFGGLRVVCELDLIIKQGECSSIIGPNGAGKTTLFNLITKYLSPDSGSIIFRGEDITRLPPWEISWRGIARSFQGINIFPRLTAYENVQVTLFSRYEQSSNLFSRAKNLFKKETFEILDIVGLSNQAELESRELSAGNQKRLELAIALAAGPELLLLDEPTAGVAPEETLTIIHLIERLARQRGTAVVFIEHDMSVVFAVSEKVRVMHEGRIIAEGKPDSIRRNEQVQRVYLGVAE